MLDTLDPANTNNGHPSKLAGRFLLGLAQPFY